MNAYDELRNLLLSLQQLGPSMWNQIDAGLLKIEGGWRR